MNDRAYYGLQDPSLDFEKAIFNSIEEMATAYREAIQKAHTVRKPHVLVLARKIQKYLDFNHHHQ